VTVNVEKTRAYYCSIRPEDLCDCAYCALYRGKVRAAYPALAAYLADLGVDIEKPFETSPLEPDKNGMMAYCACQYVVFGAGASFRETAVGAVTVRLARSYPSTGITEEHFLLECSPVYLPMKEESL